MQIFLTGNLIRKCSDMGGDFALKWNGGLNEIKLFEYFFDVLNELL